MIAGSRERSTGRSAVDVTIPARPDSVVRARDSLRALGAPTPLIDTARLLVSELVTNSIRHAGLTHDALLRVRASWSGGVLRVCVREPDAPVLHADGAIRPAPGAESGWGLYLVDRLSTRWGIDARRGYWFELEDVDGG